MLKRSLPQQQMSFASYEFSRKKRVMRREGFLAEMEKVVPWARLGAVIEPLYPSAGRVGRQPIGVPKMLDVYCLRQWVGLSDEGLEDAIYDSQALRVFVGIDRAREAGPDVKTLLKFRRLLEANWLTKAIFCEFNAHLSERGMVLREGTMVDATIIAAPSSTKDEGKARDAEIHQTKKGNAWHFGMKAHIGADANSSLVHSVQATATNEADVAHVHEVLHVQEAAVRRRRLHGCGQAHRNRRGGGSRRDSRRHRLACCATAQRDREDGRRLGQGYPARARAGQGAAACACRASVPRGQKPVSLSRGALQGLAKNAAQLFSLFGIASLVVAKRRLMDWGREGRGAPV